MNPLIKQQYSLQDEAKELLEKLELASTLNKIGEMFVVGLIQSIEKKFKV